MPAITFSFFLLLSSVIFLVILPRFAQMFSSLGQELPTFTKHMMLVSNFCMSWYMIVVVAIVVGLIALAVVYIKTGPGKLKWDTFVLRIPFVSGIIRDRFIVYYTYSLALLIKGGMRLVPAMRAVEISIGNHLLREYACVVAD